MRKKKTALSGREREKDFLLPGFVESSPIPAFVIGSNHLVTHWNRALEALSGIAASDVIGTDQHWRAFYSTQRPCMADILVDGSVGKLRKWYRNKYRKSTLIEDAYEATDFFPDLEGGGRWLRFTAALIRDPEGKAAGAVETLEDITERKLAEGALRESEQRLFSVIDGSPIAAFVIGKDHRVIYWNRALEHLSRVPAREVVGTSDQWRAFYLEKRPCLADLLVDQAFKKIPRWYFRKYGKSPIHEGAYEATDFFPDLGTAGRWLHFTAAAIRDSRKQLVGAIETLADITERKIAEAELFKAREELEIRVVERTSELSFANKALQDELQKRMQVQAALKQTMDRLSLILESLPIVSFTSAADEHFGMTFVSSSIEEITGYSPRRFIEDPSFWMERIHPDDRQSIVPDMRLGLRKKNTFKCGYRFRVADDSFRWFSDYRKIIHLPDGTAQIVGALQDVTEDKKIRQEAELRLQQMIQGQKLTALGEMVAGVAHEINNPISFISYNIPILEQIWDTVEPLLIQSSPTHPEWERKGLDHREISTNMREIIRAFQVAASRINRVVTNLKEFSRPEDAGRKKPVRIEDVIQGALNIVSSQIRKTVSDIKQEIERDIPQIPGYPQRIEQVVANLLINAHQAIPPDRTGKISIRARYIKRLETALVEIEDNGKGMDRGVLDKIFNPFFTTRRDSGGTGLGLSISYGLIKEHNGTIGVLSRPGIGSRFSIYLPVKEGKKLALCPACLCLDTDARFLKEIKANLVDAITRQVKPGGLAQLAGLIQDYPEIDIVLLEAETPAGSWEVLDFLKEKFPLLAVIMYSRKDGLPLRKGPGRMPDAFIKGPFKFEQLKKIIHETGRQRL